MELDLKWSQPQADPSGILTQFFFSYFSDHLSLLALARSPVSISKHTSLLQTTVYCVGLKVTFLPWSLWQLLYVLLST